jgi:hypothetical protein
MMEDPPEAAAGLISTMRAMQPYADRVVLIGGWVPVVYRWAGIIVAHGPVLMTRDIDIALPRVLSVVGRPLDDLLTAIGLVAEFRSRDDPPVVAYMGRLAGVDVEVEFLTHEPGATAHVVKPQPTLHAQSLHYLAILLDGAVDLFLEVRPGSLLIRVPSPGAFVYQKGLAFPSRKHRFKRAKDLYYMFDVLEHVGVAKVADELRGVSSRHPTRWLATFRSNLSAAFIGPMAEGPLLVTEQRPAGVLPILDDAQLRNYVGGLFGGFIDSLGA